MGEVVDISRPEIQNRPVLVEVQHHALALDADAHNLHVGYSSPDLQVHVNVDLIQQERALDAFVPTRAAKFWRFDKGLPLIPYPDTDRFRLDQLNAVYNRLGGLSDEEKEHRSKWIKGKSSINQISRLMMQAVKIGPDFYPKPAIELFDNPYVNHYLLNELVIEGDPKLTVLKAFERERVHHTLDNDNHPRVEKEDLEKGYRAFELFLFGAGGTAFRKKLAEIAKIHYVELT